MTVATSNSAAEAAEHTKLASHPLRVRILGRLAEGVASPNEMAKEFEESLPLVSYHVRILREGNAIRLVRTTPRRGAIEHHYRLAPDGEHILDRHGPTVRLDDLAGGAFLVHVCAQRGCTARHVMDIGDTSRVYTDAPEGWGWDNNPRGGEEAVLHCPEHRR
jgi:DNA-binding transcriptional ArsR family regulator